MNVSDLVIETKILPILRMAFRPFFMFSGIFASISIIIWMFILNGFINIESSIDPVFWHSHEMIFGFAGASIAGFLLTAVQNWSGIRGIHGKSLFFVVLIWLSGRIVPFLPISVEYKAFISILFFPSVIVFLSIPIIKARLYRNLFFIPILIILTTCSAMMWYSYINNNSIMQRHFSTSAIHIITMLVLVIGGRVIPMFTSNGLSIKPFKKNILLNNFALFFAWFAVLFELIGFNHYLDMNVGYFYLLAGLLNSLRSFLLKPFSTLKNHLLWSLHFGFFTISIGLFLNGLFCLGWLNIAKSVIIHVYTIGVIGLMIISMMSRVSLGHSGRKLLVKPIVGISFICIVIALFSRTLALTLFPEHYLLFINTAVLFWVFGFFIFSITYIKIFVSPRIDGHPG